MALRVSLLSLLWCVVSLVGCAHPRTQAVTQVPLRWESTSAPGTIQAWQVTRCQATSRTDVCTPTEALPDGHLGVEARTYTDVSAVPGQRYCWTVFAITPGKAAIGPAATADGQPLCQTVQGLAPPALLAPSNLRILE